MNFCSRCGCKLLNEKDIFCTYCGNYLKKTDFNTEILIKKIYFNYCQNCGIKEDILNNFCTICGFPKFDTSIEENLNLIEKIKSKSDDLIKENVPKNKGIRKLYKSKVFVNINNLFNNFKTTLLNKFNTKGIKKNLKNENEKFL